MRKAMAIIGVLAAGVFAVGLAGCQSDAQTGALVGGVGGAAAGQAIGGNTEGTLIGAAVGTGAGYIIGNESDKAKQSQRIAQTQEMANTTVVNVHNSNGSITPVTLRWSGNMWVGPGGEQYANVPTEDQLRTLYGTGGSLSAMAGQPVMPQQAPTVMVVPQAPPTMIVETRPYRPAGGHIWVDGYWVWNGRGYSWQPGHWEIPPRGYQVWVSPRYQRHDRGYHYTPGYWR